MSEMGVRVSRYLRRGKTEGRENYNKGGGKRVLREHERIGEK